MYQRPKAGESDEDLLKFQEEFFKLKSNNDFKPAATVVNKTIQDKSDTNSELPTEEIQEHLDNTFEDIPKNAKIGKIVEKKPDAPRISKFKFSRSSGFPQAKRRDPTVSTGTGSLFSQQMKKIKPNPDIVQMEVDSLPIDPSNLKIKENVPLNLPSTSIIVSGKEKDDIHQENLDIMSKMSEQEILEERERLMSTLDPAIIAFLKSKRHHNKPVIENRQPSIAQQNKEEVNIEDIETTKEILLQPEADKWVNFDILETNKLAWMKDIDVPKIIKDKQYEARFDFGGWLLPFAEKEINEKNRILYHHGEESGRPGYTLQELFQLCRSSVIQQKITALNTIANILSLQSSGIYNDIIDIPIEQVFFVVRFCLDENSPATLNASIKAMRNIFYYLIDETCLENMLGFGLGIVQPIISVNDDEVEDDKTVNDQQLAETNLIRCLARTDILVRIRYILNTVKPSIETIVYCLEILIRLVRDSNFIMHEVYQCDGLVETIVKNFIPKMFTQSGLSGAYGLPITHAIKFVRILSARSKLIAEDLIEKYKIMDSIATYISNEFVSTNTNGLKLQIDSFNLWQTFASYGLALDYFKILQPMLLRLLNYHLQNTNVAFTTSYTIQAHTASFLNLLTEVAKHDYNSILIYCKLIFDTAIAKWITQFSMLHEFSCGKLQIISSLFRLLTALIKYQLPNVHLPFEKVYDIVGTMLKSEGFNHVTSNIKSGSNVLNNYETHKCSANFKYTEAAVWNASDHIIPVLQTNSSIPFLSALSSFIQTSKSQQLKIQFINHPNIQKYLKLLQNSSKYYLTYNWYTKIESNLVINILKISIDIQKSLDTGLYYEIAVKTLSIFNSEQKTDLEYILRNLIFSPKFYPSEVLIKNLNLSEENSVLKTCLDNIDDIFEVYIKVLGLRTPCDMNSLSVDIKIGNIIPMDWIYSPIIVLYSNQQQEKSSIQENEQISIVTNCLRWVYIYETYFPLLATIINPTDRFCRLACTFLGSDTLFLIPEVKQLLELCLKHILSTSEAAIDFDRSIHGLNNFQDFYTQLLEQYQGVSYGDVLFGNYILVPLAQKHNIKFRKTLWSEYAGIVQIFNVKETEVLCSMQSFLEPEESDMSLLHCYRRALTSGAIRQFSVLYKIAKHHVECFVAKKKANLKK